MGALGWWAAFFVMPLAVQWEFPLATVDRIPVFGFCLGIVLGLAIARWEPVRRIVWFVIGSIVLGWLAWLFIVTIVGFGLTIVLDDEAFDQAMETVNTVAAWIAGGFTAVAIGAGIFALLHGGAGALVERFGPKRRKAP